jgi:hypothetical protein
MAETLSVATATNSLGTPKEANGALARCVELEWEHESISFGFVDAAFANDSNGKARQRRVDC